LRIRKSSHGSGRNTGSATKTVARLKIGFADDGEPSAARALMDGPGAFTMRD
jgi:hypothetical protein